jgi:hypothetical protein
MERMLPRVLPAFLTVLWIAGLASSRAAAQVGQPGVPTASGGVIQGVVTAVNGTIPLGGVLVSLASDRSATVVTVLSDSDGAFAFEGLGPGRYEVSAVLEGFERRAATVDLEWNQYVRVPLDLRLAATERVDVVATTTAAVPETGTLIPGEVISGAELEETAPGGLEAALRLFVGVIEVPGGLSIKGGLPNQATVQIGSGAFVDPATGLSRARLPDDAIDSVRVLPNPYAVEFGRFSSGLVLIETRRAADAWKARVNGLDPSFRTRRHEPLNIEGFAAFSPRLEIGGPVVRDRVFLQQSAQYRYRSSDVASRPQSELRTSHGLSSFTRLDANLSPTQTLVIAGGLFPSVSRQFTLGTFTPPDATIDLRSNVSTLSVSQRSIWNDTMFSETTIDMNRYFSDVRPQAVGTMELLPGTTLGPFYNRHRRTTMTYQVVHTVSGSSERRSGLHLYKVGADLLYSRYRSNSISQPILIRRSDGTLARRLDFGPRSWQMLNSTDLALFGQDRVQPGSRWYLEFGGRLDRDGVTGRWNLTPRLGTALLLNEAGSAVARGGYGVFFERTASAAGVFDQYERVTERRFAADGTTLIGAPIRFESATDGDLRTSRSLTWDAAYDHRFSPEWAIHAGVIDRRGSFELLVDPRIEAGAGVLLLQSRGRSVYREVEAGVHFTRGTLVDLNVSYVRSVARADLNAFSTFYDSVRRPVLGRNAYGPATSDAPHRLVARGRAMPTDRWLLVGAMDWRSGLPYSIVDESLDFVGDRNTRRFPAYLRVELGVERRIRLFKRETWIGVRAENAFDAFLPTDVQANISSPDFGRFYNSEYRQFRIQFRFAR